MFFNETNLDGVFEIEIEKNGDERGFFGRAYCKKEFGQKNISFKPVQANVGYSKFKNTLRGLHYQRPPHAEQKLVRCVKGKIFDVIVDLRSSSSTYRQWAGFELSAENMKGIFVPEGCAHGYQTLMNDSEIFYMVSAFYTPEAEQGIRWNDPSFNIEWKEAENMIISDKDRQWADYL